MTRKIYNCDDPAQMKVLQSAFDGAEYGPGALPRKLAYGLEPGLKPLGDYPDMLVHPKDLKEVIQHCREHQLFPVFHQHATWAPPGYRHTQDGTNFCWAFAAGAAMMDLQAREGKRNAGDDLLAPITMGWLVNWRNAGYYLGDTIRGLKERGMAPMSCVPDQHSRNHRAYSNDWEERALENRLADDGVFDASPRNMLQHALTILRTGSPGYAAWPGHAMTVAGIKWDESKYQNVIWEVRNSHNEDDVIEMHGRRAMPDEFYGFNSSKT